MVYRVLIVDDSAFMRVAISKQVAESPNFRVVGIARNGEDAIERVKQLKPDVVTMDVEMPKMDGLTAVREIMESCPVPIVMVSSLIGKGSDMAMQALHAGAVDCIAKDEWMGHTDDASQVQFFERLEAAVHANMLHRKTQPQAISPSYVTKSSNRKSVRAVVIGCSTGGPAALQSILPQITTPLPVPLIVAQHMPPGFTKSLADRLARICSVPVKEAEDGERLQKGYIYIAPSGRQTTIEEKNAHLTFKLLDSAPVVTRFRPSVDVLLLSAAPVLREHLFVLILTGMGNDGTIGCEEVKKYRGHVVTQSEQSCVVYGMPKAVVNAGCSDEQIALSEMTSYMLDYVAGND